MSQSPPIIIYIYIYICIHIAVIYSRIINVSRVKEYNNNNTSGFPTVNK